VLDIDQSPDKVQLAIVNYRKEGSRSQARTLSEHEHLVFLLLPVLSPQALPVRMEIRSDPAPCWQPPHDLQTPFHIGSMARLYVISLWVHRGDRARCATIFVPAETFMGALPTELARQSIEWGEWGPTGTRIRLPLQGPSPVWACYVYGMKYVDALSDISEDNVSIRIQDFNQLLLRREMAEGAVACESEEGEGDKSWTIVTGPSVLDQGVFFRDRIETSLGYRVRKHVVPALEGHYCCPMCSEDSIILVYVRPMCCV
jgi:hypothetical protein